MDLGSGRNLCTSHILSNPSNKRFENCPVRGTRKQAARLLFTCALGGTTCFCVPEGGYWRRSEKSAHTCATGRHITAICGAGPPPFFGPAPDDALSWGIRVKKGAVLSEILFLDLQVHMLNPLPVVGVGDIDGAVFAADDGGVAEFPFRLIFKREQVFPLNAIGRAK